MPRIERGFVDGFIYHVMNRGNGGQRVFHEPRDYQTFIEILKRAKELFAVKVFAYCLMPNHFHMVVSPAIADQLSRWMQWVMTSYVRQYHHEYGTRGHLWQGRFRSCIVQQNDFFLTLIRYVEANPMRGGLVSSARDWTWSSHRETMGQNPCALVDKVPIELPKAWGIHVDTPLRKMELERLRESVRRQSPYGTSSWQSALCSKLGLESTIRPRGRPRKTV